MLVLSRKENERIMIGDDVECVVLSIRGDKVRLGFKAPVEIPIDRSEVRESKLAANNLPSSEYADADSSHARTY